MKIYFKLKAFPQISETFIVNNIIYAKSKGYEVGIYVDCYNGIENSSQSELLKKYNIERDIIKPITFSTNKVKKTFQVLRMLLNLKILFYLIPYYKLKRKKNLTPLVELYQYRSFKNQIVHVHFNNATHPLVELSSIGYINPKCIITFHGYDAYLEDKNSFQIKYSEFYKKHVVGVTINSKHLTIDVLKLGVDKNLVTIVPIGIDIDFFRGSPKNINVKKIKILSVGRLVQWKGHIYGLKAIKHLTDKGYEVEYTVIGAGNLEQELKNEAKKLDIYNTVTFLGALPQKEVFKYMKSSDIFLLPSTFDNKVGRRETFGLVSVEAQAVGLPVVGFNSGGFPETLIDGQTGFVVEDRNVEALSEKIEYLITHPNQYAKMSKAAINHASKFDHKKTTQQYLELYKTLTH
ncbi:glycosyltransferase family 4 protein [Flavobacterium sp. CS20]|uniref:glycosyltransferase family 4 protein n=1 Tax=Flavobacterium sp. CS20 TaxID=2775246 RepID=UPI001B39CF65|nr:glycosyltransferase family 4 protein [Flavobacterium sp. CS20]QTY27710.1 glycosyltransferase family 4 protein [Flavobacterium sp. CS20]